MRRDQLEHAIRTACQIIERPEVIVVGSQAILGSFREDELPADATMSVEVDILPIRRVKDVGAYQDQISGYGGIKHCLIPSPKHVLLGYDKNGKLVDSLYAKEQTAQSMLKILGYM